MQLLKNQVYIGDMVQGKRQVASFKTKQWQFLPTEDWIVVPDTHEAIIDPTIWTLVQKRIEATKAATTRNVISVNSSSTVSLFSGIIRCADCGATMAFNRKLYKGNARLIYRCSRYANNGKEQCSTHSVTQEMLEQVILADMRYYAEVAVRDEKALASRILAASGRERDRERSAKRQSIAKSRKRLDAVDRMVRQLFEEKVAGSVPLTTFQKLLNDYEQERACLDDQIRTMEGEIQADGDTERDVLIWMGLIKNSLSPKTLDRETAYRLIDNIAVSERVEVNGKKHQNILIQYNFVGCLDQHARASLS
jgi:hypothetical protein